MFLSAIPKRLLRILIHLKFELIKEPPISKQVYLHIFF